MECLLAFHKDPASLREAKLFVYLLAIVNQIDKIVASKPAWEVSADLNVSSSECWLQSISPTRDLCTQTNIQKFALAVLLSSKINVYKGDGPTNSLLVRLRFTTSSYTDLHVYIQAIIKKYRFDLPAGIENNPADWAKVVAVGQDALTQKRSRIKKAVSILYNGIQLYLRHLSRSAGVSSSKKQIRKTRQIRSTRTYLCSLKTSSKGRNVLSMLSYARALPSWYVSSVHHHQSLKSSPALGLPQMSWW